MNRHPLLRGIRRAAIAIAVALNVGVIALIAVAWARQTPGASGETFDFLRRYRYWIALRDKHMLFSFQWQRSGSWPGPLVPTPFRTEWRYNHWDFFPSQFTVESARFRELDWGRHTSFGGTLDEWHEVHMLYFWIADWLAMCFALAPTALWLAAGALVRRRRRRRGFEVRALPPEGSPREET